MMITKEQKERYNKYINSKEWKELKLDLLQIRGCNCEKCNRPQQPNKIQVHHKTYDRLYNELATDLILLCGTCHMKEHGIKKDKKKPTVKPKKVTYNIKKKGKTAKSIYEKSLRKIKMRYERGQYPTYTIYERVLKQAHTKYKNMVLKGF